MLIELRIENFAIIHRLELELGAGLVTFTGETGAGKSIILDAIETLLGGHARHLRCMLVHPGEEERVLPTLAVVTGKDVRRDRRVRVTDVGRRVHVVDRRRYVVGHGRQS